MTETKRIQSILDRQHTHTYEYNVWFLHTLHTRIQSFWECVLRARAYQIKI